MTHLAGYPSCLKAGMYVCQKPSGQACIDCGEVAGTRWGWSWCPDCDSKHVTSMREHFAAALGTNEEDER